MVRNHPLKKLHVRTRCLLRFTNGCLSQLGLREHAWCAWRSGVGVYRLASTEQGRRRQPNGDSSITHLLHVSLAWLRGPASDLSEHSATAEAARVGRLPVGDEAVSATKP